MGAKDSKSEFMCVVNWIEEKERWILYIKNECVHTILMLSQSRLINFFYMADGRSDNNNNRAWFLSTNRWDGFQ